MGAQDWWNPFTAVVAPILNKDVQDTALDILTGGAKSQQKAIDKAIAATQGAERARLEIMRDLIAEGKPFREALTRAGLRTIPRFTEASLGSLGLLQQDVLREPGTGPEFTTGLRRGTRAIMEELAPYGLTDSSVTGRAIGDLTEGLLSRDIANLRESRFRLAGFAPGAPESTLGAATGFGGQAAGLTGIRAGLLSQSPMADFYKDLLGAGTQLGSLALLA